MFSYVFHLYNRDLFFLVKEHFESYVFMHDFPPASMMIDHCLISPYIFQHVYFCIMHVLCVKCNAMYHVAVLHWDGPPSWNGVSDG